MKGNRMANRIKYGMALIAFAGLISAGAQAQDQDRRLQDAKALEAEMGKAGEGKGSGLSERALQELSLREKLEAKAKAAGLDKRPEVAARMRMASQGALIDAFMEDLRSAATVEEKTLRQDYEVAYPPIRQAEIEAALFERREDAIAARKRIAKGASSVSAEAKKGSNEILRSSGGKMGFMALNSFPEKEAAALERAKDGELLAEPIETPFGHMIVRVLRKKTEPEKTFEEARAQLEENRRQLMAKIRLKEILAE